MRRSRRGGARAGHHAERGHSGQGGTAGGSHPGAGGAEPEANRTTGTAGMSNVGSSSTSTEVSSTTSVSTSFTTGLFPCVDGGPGRHERKRSSPSRVDKLALAPRAAATRPRVPRRVRSASMICAAWRAFSRGERSAWNARATPSAPRAARSVSKARAMGAAPIATVPPASRVSRRRSRMRSRSPAASAQQV